MKRDEFEVLYALYRGVGGTQRDLAACLGFSLGKVNGIVTAFVKAGFVDEGNRLTRAGIAALKPYKVDNAIIMAAGMSSRFAPLSYEKPKGVLVVKGEVLIERQIRQLQAAGIDDITVVVGYMKEKFFYLADKFNVKIVVNEDYYRYNNPSTLIRVADKLRNTYICSSDNYFTENVFEPYAYDAYYAATYFPGYANEWGIKADRKGRIVGIDHAPKDMWCMMGHVYFSQEFSSAFVKLLKEKYDDDDVRKALWEHLFERNLKTLRMSVRKYSSDVIKEFDSLDELRSFDERYLENADSKIFRNICRVLKCREREIEGIEVIKQGLTNLSFKFICRGKAYVYRHPGIGTEAYISRRSEAFSLGVAKRLGLDPTVVHIDPKTGWKISHYIEGARNLDYHNKSDVSKALELLRTLHTAAIRSRYVFDLGKKTAELVKLTAASHKDFDDFKELKSKMAAVGRALKGDSRRPVLCHCDSYAPNFLVDKRGKMVLIDWEYSGASDPGCDLGTFICCSDFTYKEALGVLREYYGRKELAEADLRHDIACVAMAAWYWFVWAIYQESRGNAVGEYLFIWYRYTKLYAAKALELYQGIK